MKGIKFPMLRTLEDVINISNNEELTAVDLPLLETISGRVIIKENPALKDINLSKLKTLDDSVFITDNDAMSTLEIPKLETTSRLFIWGNQLTSLEFPSLESAGSVDINKEDALSVLNLAKLRTVDSDFSVERNVALTSLDISLLETIDGELKIQKNSALTTLELPSLTSVQENSISFDYNGLDVVSVNGLLEKLASISPALTGKSINLRQTPATTPTAQGLTDKSILEENGNTVQTD
ncbi:hypothetical protein SAMN04487911_10188 [Arenibacter nanhaiticus]|uniref:Leucine rich repeat-containing protein n=1 Tax=Arenibacter nanhaiticus TaxID=558155 RepID=A0A1M6A577_9FLAO|nr:hypothetical protein SAMN04487911_10188 [Arenibacter nanhaiticus]